MAREALRHEPSKMRFAGANQRDALRFRNYCIVSCWRRTRCVASGKHQSAGCVAYLSGITTAPLALRTRGLFIETSALKSARY